VRRVTLLTDFGTADGYAAAVAGVVAAAAPDAVVEHAAHDIAHGDLTGAALALARYAHRYPEGTVHLAVVDPGVGTDRRPLAAEVDGRYYVAPDNGVLSLILQGARRVRIVEITVPELVDGASSTFHGRDVFAPAAAHLARGGALDGLGTPVHDPALLAVPQPTRMEAGARGEVLTVDRFGNLITNIPRDWLPENGEVAIDGAGVGAVRRTYGDVGPGELVALVGSTELLEVSVRDGSAADRLGVGRGAEVTVR
jgi:S-adenosyl-L-methionine hydrolase (adenosine-forming)